MPAAAAVTGPEAKSAGTGAGLAGDPRRVSPALGSAGDAGGLVAIRVGDPRRARSGPSAILTDAAAWERIERARRRYLLSIGIDPAVPRRRIAFGSDRDRD